MTRTCVQDCIFAGGKRMSRRTDWGIKLTGSQQDIANAVLPDFSSLRRGNKVLAERDHAKGDENRAPSREEQPSCVKQTCTAASHRYVPPSPLSHRDARRQGEGPPRALRRTLPREFYPLANYSSGVAGALFMCFAMRASRLASNCFIFAC
jgi:hypothetical protein